MMLINYHPLNSLPHSCALMIGLSYNRIRFLKLILLTEFRLFHSHMSSAVSNGLPRRGGKNVIPYRDVSPKGINLFPFSVSSDGYSASVVATWYD